MLQLITLVLQFIYKLYSFMIEIDFKVHIKV